MEKLKHKYFVIRNLDESLKKHVEVALPAAAWGEYRGTFTNYDGRVQKLEKAFEPLGQARPVWQWMIDLSAHMKKPLQWNNVDDIFEDMSKNFVHFEDMNFKASEGEVNSLEPTRKVING